MTRINKDDSPLKAMLRRRQSRPTCATFKVILGVVFISIFFYMISYQNDFDQLHTTDKNRCSILERSSEDEISKLEDLNLKDCNLRSISSRIQYATNLRKLDVSGNKYLSTLPEELSFCTKLDILFASSCPSMKQLPEVLGRTNITRLGWRSGSLTSIDPNSIPPNVVHLILTNNQIKEIDNDEIFLKLQNVRKLMLSHNNISKFGSQGLEHMKSLELLRLAGNDLNDIPSQLWDLPKLTWLTISGNPVINEVKVQNKDMEKNLPSITFKDLSPLGENLGEGASGKVYLYKWNGKEVAVKIIHGVTSDGKAEDELAIYNTVGSSGVENRVVGCLALLDDEKKGIIMEPLPKNLDDFALPPTIEEVTADRWDKKEVFSASFVKDALTDAVSALHFLHNRGISHGDFYAHK